jgi:hypothetical protein
VLAADEARRYLALSDGNLEIAVRVFEDAFQIDESAPPALPASPSASDMAVDSPARMIDLTQDSPVTRITGNYADLTDDVFHGATEDDDDDDASLAAAIAMSLFTDDAAAGPPPPLARTVSVRAKSELTELMEQQDRDFQAALSKDRERAAATASTASTASTTNVTPTTTTKEASTASTTNVTPTTATKEAEVVDKDALLAVPAEPVAGTAGVVTVRFTLPGGTRVARRFLPQTSVAELRAAVRQEMLHDKVPSFEFMIPMSKTTFGDATQTLAALGLTGGVAITVIEK